MKLKEKFEKVLKNSKPHFLKELTNCLNAFICSVFGMCDIIRSCYKADSLTSSTKH